MSKDAYYFSHDSNAHTDPKILKLRMSLGWEGYGIYWAIIENLRNQEDYTICESEFMFLTLSLAIDEAKLKQMLSKCLEVNLLEISNGKVFSPSLLRRMERADEIRNKRRLAGAKGGKAKANAKQKGKQNSSIKEKETKEKESKLNNIEINLPDFVDVELWDEFMAVRKKLKAQNTQRAINTLINILNSNKEQANDMLEKSVVNSWKSLFPDKNFKSDNNKTVHHGIDLSKSFLSDEELEEMSFK